MRQAAAKNNPAVSAATRQKRRLLARMARLEKGWERSKRRKGGA